MSADFYQLVVVSIVVVIDNALLAGLLLPPSGRKRMMQIAVMVGVALGIAQVILAAGVESLLEVSPFRLLATAILVWMSIHTVRKTRLDLRGSEKSVMRIAFGVFFYSAMGNLDNMIWLGTYLNGNFVWLIFFSLITIPLFAAVSLFLCNQCQKYGWISILGAGMMAWAAASLCLITQPAQMIAIQLPPLTFHVLFTLIVLVAGFAFRKFRIRI